MTRRRFAYGTGNAAIVGVLLVVQGCSSCRISLRSVPAVVVPVYFYKIIVVQEKSVWKALAFAIPNTDFKAPYQLAAYVTSIDWIERQTGIEFLPDLEDGKLHAMKVAAAALWPWRLADPGEG